MVDPAKHPVLYWLYKNFSLDSGRNLVTILLIALGVYFLVFRPVYQAGRRAGVGEVTKQQGMIVKDIKDVQDAVEKGYKFTLLEEKYKPPGENITFVASGEKLPAKNTWQQRIKPCAATTLKNTGVGVAIEEIQVWRVNLDGILTTMGFGEGLSYDVTENFYAGGGINVPYDIEDWSEIGEKAEIMAYGGFRF